MATDDSGSEVGGLPPPVPPPHRELPSDDTTTTGNADEDGSAGFFILDPDGGGFDSQCDIFGEDCPRGEKCMGVALDGARTWNATRCMPIARDPAAPGEPCTVQDHPLSGLDDCELHSMCWDVSPVTLEGWCIAMCIGDENNPTCEDPAAVCEISASGPNIFCHVACNPLLHQCGEGRGCYPIADELRCAPDVSGDATVGSPCEFINVCPDGSACVGGPLVPDCPDAGCCSAFCALDDPEPPCLPGQSCEPWYEPGEVPAALEQLGICGVPA